MGLAEIERAALELAEHERASLAVTLLDTLSVPGTDISDAEVDHREAELDSGMVKPITLDEFVRGVRNGRGR